jgi:hypothetical protein
MALSINTDPTYKSAKSKTKDYSINDGGGLFLFVGAGGSKLWRFVYTFNGTRKKIAFGAYPSVTLDAARRDVEKARGNIAKGLDPIEIRRDENKAKRLSKSNNDRVADGLPILNSFADIAGQWLRSVEHLTKPTTQTKKTSRLERLAFPTLGDMAINQIKSSDIMAILKPLIDKNSFRQPTGYVVK